MVRVLKAVCILVTATVVLFVLVNVLAAYVYPHGTRAVVSAHPVFNEATRATYEKIYQLPISEIREGVDECWTEDAWFFEPYVQFRERPRTGQFVNISANGSCDKREDL
jgi:hypothetical protein